MADMIKFFKGLEASLPASGVNGALYITTDEGAIYLGTGTGMKRLGDFVQVANVASLPAKAHESCLYYCVAENILAKWNGTEWKQINKQPTAEELKTLLGLGSAAYEDASAFDAAGAAQEVRDYVGDIPENYTETTVIAYINKKAEETLNAASGGSSESAASVLAALNTYKAENDPKVTANTNAITAIKDGATVDSFADVEAAVAEAVNGINNKVGTVAEGKTVVQMIADAQEAATYDDREVKTLIGEDAGKSARTIANEELAKQLIPENAAATLNELQEIAAWIQAHPGDASAMNLAIQALEGKLAGIDTTVVAYVTSAIDALKIGDYAKASDLLLLTNRVSALEEDTHTHGNKDVLDGITSEGVASWNTASTTAATAVQSVAAGSGLKATRSGNEATIDFDPNVVFIFNCGDSTAV